MRVRAPGEGGGFMRSTARAQIGWCPPELLRLQRALQVWRVGKHHLL